MDKDLDKRFQSDFIGMDIVSRQHPFNVHHDKVFFDEKKFELSQMIFGKKPSLFFRIIRRFFHAIFIIWGVLFIWEILAFI